MSKITEFYARLPEMLWGAFDKGFKRKDILAALEFFHEETLRQFRDTVRKEWPAWPDDKIDYAANFAYLNFLGSRLDTDSIEYFLNEALIERLDGNMARAEMLMRKYLKTLLVDSSKAASMVVLSAFAEKGEKFVNSTGHQTKAENFKARDALICGYLQKYLEDGVSKSNAYERLENKYSVSARQLQRIVKKLKTT